MAREQLLTLVKQVVRDIEPAADVLVFGSRARRDDRDHSDWDFLVLVDGSLPTERDQRIRRALYEIEWSTGEVISPIIRTRQQWSDPLVQASPFYRNVERDGILL